jgi:hypothetical protein
LAVDSFDYCVIGETTEEILWTKFAKIVFTGPGSKERTSIGFLKESRAILYSSQKTKELVR